MHFKYTLFFFTVLLLSVNSKICWSQSNIYPKAEMEIELTTNNPTGIWKSDGSILVNVKQGKAPFNFYISQEPAPISTEDFLLIAENKNVSEFSFENLGKGTYYVFVRDSEMKTQCIEAIILNKTKSNQE